MNFESDSNSKKNKARKTALNEAAKVLPGTVFGIESLNVPETWGEIPQEEPQEAVSDNPEQWVSEDIQEPIRYADIFKGRLFTRDSEPVKPIFDQEKSDRLKKIALAKGIANALGSIHSIGLQNRGGIAGKADSGFDDELMTDIQFLDDDYLKRMTDYNEQLRALESRNNQLTNQEAQIGLGMYQTAQNQKREDDKIEQDQEFRKAEGQKDRDLKKWLAEEEGKLKNKNYDLEYQKTLNFNKAQDVETAKAYNIAIQREQDLYKQMANDLDVSTEDRSEQLQKIKDLVAQRDQILNQLAQREGFEVKPEEKQEAPTPANQSLLNAIENYKPSASAQIQQSAGNQQSTKSADIVNQYNSIMDQALKDKSINRDQINTLLRAAEAAAKASGKKFNERKLIDYLKSQGVELPNPGRDLKETVGSIFKPKNTVASN